MKIIGFLLITVGFLAGALVAVVDEEQVNWLHFGASICVGIVGVGMVRFGHRKQTHGEGKLALNMQEITSILERIVDGTTRLNAEKDSIYTYDMRHRIDETIAAEILAFADAREAIAIVCGLGVYADIMSHFAAGERYLNRVWSASADGYIDEVNAYLEKSRYQFTQTLDLIKKQNQNT
jgi:hypothetical protein